MRPRSEFGNQSTERVLFKPMFRFVCGSVVPQNLRRLLQRSMSSVTILDGGLGTELEISGLSKYPGHDELWTARVLLNQPQAMKDLHASFLKYGADIIETGTYQASIDGYMKYAGLSQDEAVKTMQNAVKIAQEAVQEFWTDYQAKLNDDKEREELVFTDRQKPQIAASIAPYGAWLADDSDYNGHYVDTMTKQELQSWHRKHIQILVDAGINLLAIETIPAQKEAEAILEILPEFPGVKALLTFSSKSETKICHEESFAEAVSSICRKSCPDQLLAVGLNCTRPQYITPLLRSAVQAAAGRPFVINPKGESSPGVLTEWTKLVPDWLDLGVRYIGGCCHTRPCDIQTIRETAKQHVGSQK